MANFDLANALQVLSVALIPVLFGITVHEVAHGWMARQLGDRTAELLGRLTLNPIRHIDPFGTVLVPIMVFVLSGGKFLFGWAKPVPINPRGLRNPKRDMVAVAAAGPAVNLLMGLGWAIIYALVARLGADGVTASFVLEMARIGVLFNALLAVFNLIPLPPLDGGRVLRGLVPEVLGRRLDAIEPFGLIIILLLLSFGLIWPILGPLIALVQRILFGLAGLLGG